MKKALHKHTIPILALILVGIGVLLYPIINPSREAIIRDIMTILYTCPNPKVLDGLANQKEDSEIALDLYGKYLTDELNDEFKIGHYAAKDQCLITQYCDELGYEVKIEKIMIRQPQWDEFYTPRNNEEYHYHAKVNILYGKKGTLKKATFDNHRTEEACIYFDQSGRTNKIEILRTDRLLKSILYELHQDLQESKESKDN